MARIMGLDIGTKRIGVTLSDELEIIASSYTVIDAGFWKEIVSQLKNIIEKFDVRKIVVGMPYNMDGTIGPRGAAVLEFIQRLKKEFHLPILTWDERRTTVEAEQILIRADLSRKKRRGIIDKVAATIILQGYLDSQEREQVRK